MSSDQPVPQGWVKTTLGHVCRFGGGCAFKEEYQGSHSGELPFIKVSDINLPGNRKYILAANNWVSAKTKSEIRATAFPANSTVFPKVGAALLSNRRRLLTRPTIIDNNMMAAVPSERVDPCHLYYFLLTVDFSLFVQDGAVPSVNQSQLALVPCVLPPLPEQRKIAAVLSSVDTAIEKTEALVAKLRDLKTAMMQELLTKGIGHTRFKDSPLGRIPDDWEVVDCGEVCREIVVGIVVKPTQYYAPFGITLLRSANVRDGGLDLTGLVYMAPEFDSDLKKSRLHTGDVVTVRTGYPGTSCVIPPFLDGANCIDLIISRPGPGVVPEYLATWINSDSGKGQVLRAQGGLAQQHFNVGDLKRMSIALPGIAEQRRICSVLGASEDQLRSAQGRHERLHSLKKALMQDLLTGRVRVEP